MTRSGRGPAGRASSSRTRCRRTAHGSTGRACSRWRTPGPGTNGSQFFVTVAPTDWLTGKHTIFGEVTEGFEVVDAISKAPTGANDRPASDVVLERVEISD